jgi:hypothetical protein
MRAKAKKLFQQLSIVLDAMEAVETAVPFHREIHLAKARC